MTTPVSYTIQQWCDAYQITLTHYDAMKEQGTAPHELRLGDRVIITRRSSEEWEDRMLRQRTFEGDPFISL